MDQETKTFLTIFAFVVIIALATSTSSYPSQEDIYFDELYDEASASYGPSY